MDDKRTVDELVDRTGETLRERGETLLRNIIYVNCHSEEHSDEESLGQA